MDYKIRRLNIKTKKQAMDEFSRIGATTYGQKIMANKIFPMSLKVKNINPRAADILKQEMLSRMGDVVTSRDSLLLTEGNTDVIILGSLKGIVSLCEKIKIQPFGLKELSDEILKYIEHIKKASSSRVINISEKKFDLNKYGALIMGILNITPDSFYDGGEHFSKKEAIKHAEMMIEEGAHIIDIGGMSTRPGSKPITIKEEKNRIIPVIEFLSKNHDVILSVDTYRSDVARKAIEVGADIINDISAMAFDSSMAKLVADSKSSVIIMHMQGTPETMQENPEYDDVVDEIYNFLYERSVKSIEAGISPEKIIIDPGIGFGKRLEHNLEILAKISDFTSMGYPVLLGASRKSFIGKILGDIPTKDRLDGSIASAVIAFLNGVSILRVHDVKHTVRAIKVARDIMDYV